MRMKRFRKGWYHDDYPDKKEMKDEPHGRRRILGSTVEDTNKVVSLLVDFRVKQQMKVAKDELKADIGEDDGHQRMKVCR